MNQIKHIRLDKIIPPEFDARLTTDTVADEELAESIREIGVKLPLLVKNSTKGFEIIAGNRRFIAAGKVGLPSVPCIIEKVSGAEADKIKLHENLKRLPLSHVDQGYSFAHLIKEYNMTETDISRLIKMSVGYVSQHLALLQTDEVILSAVQNNNINFSVARELMRITDNDEQKRLCEYIVETGASVSVVKQWVDDSNKESANYGHAQQLETQRFSHSPPEIPQYPCAVCQTLTKFDEIRTVRMCPGCSRLFFMEIEKNRQEDRIKLSESTS